MANPPRAAKEDRPRERWRRSEPLFVWISLISCAPAPDRRSSKVPEGRSRSRSLVALSTGPSAPASASVAQTPVGKLEPPADSTLHSFRPRLVLPELPDCMIYALTPLRTGEAWVAGSCGLRARLTASGFVNLSAPTRKVHEQIGPMQWDCDGSASYRTVAPRRPRMPISPERRCAASIRDSHGRAVVFKWSAPSLLGYAAPLTDTSPPTPCPPLASTSSASLAQLRSTASHTGCWPSRWIP